eukprot:c16451_g1_i2 orf=119-1315(+)
MTFGKYCLWQVLCLWRLDPLSPQRKATWRREMDWLLSVADHIVELVPSLQTFPNGDTVEIMVSRPRSDLLASLPALRKLDAMLFESLESFTETEFWYADQGIVMADEDNQHGVTFSSQRQEEWWLPSPKVPINGLSECEDYTWRGNLLSSLDLSREHTVLDIANRVEAAIHVWRRQNQSKLAHASRKAKSSWGIVKDLVSDVDRRELLAGRAENLLLCLRQRFPGLPQTHLDTTKIQYNQDVGQSILESYSRVVESFAFCIVARIDGVLYADGLTKCSVPLINTHGTSPDQRLSYSIKISAGTPFSPLLGLLVSPQTPSPSPPRTNTPFHCCDSTPQDRAFSFSQSLPGFVDLEYCKKTDGKQAYYQGQKHFSSGEEITAWTDRSPLDSSRNLNQCND